MKMNPIFHQFNKYGDNIPSIIQKALTTATGVGGALIPENLEQVITDTVIRLSPELALAEPKSIAGKTHEFNRLTERPKRGGAMGENATTPVSNSKTARATVNLKIVRRKSKITNFLTDTSREYIDAAAYEMQNHLQAHVLDLIYYILYGSALSNIWEHTGLDTFINTNRSNQVRGGIVPSDLSFMDSLIDSSNRKGGARHRRIFGMSPEMLSKVSQLLTNVRLNQGLSGAGLTIVELNGGWRLNAYRDIPIVETTAVSPIEQLTSTATLAAEDTGVGGLSNGTYYVMVAPLTYEGEQEASTSQSVVLNAGTATQRIRISLDAVHTTNSVESALGYKVYVGTSATNHTLNRLVSAFTYDSDGTLTGDNGTGTDYIWVTSTTPTTDVPAHMRSDVPFVATGGVRPGLIYLWDLDPIQGLGKLPYTNQAGDQFNGLVTTQPLAQTDDFIQFLVKSYLALADSFESTSAWARGYRSA